MQIKTTLPFHFTPVRIAFIKNTINIKCWQGCWEKGTFIHFWWKHKLVQPLQKTILMLLRELNIDLLYDTAIPLLGVYQKECNSGYYKFTCVPMFIAALLTIPKRWKQPRCPATDEWIKKMWCLTQWNFTRTQKRMKFCHSQENGRNWEHHLKWS
jgi:hypothetical protein